MDYETEEQQLEAIKKWWKDNANMIIGGIAVGVSGIFGWQYYQDQNILHANNASVIYEQVIANSQGTDAVNDQLMRANTLQAEYSDTPYAGLAALLLAKQQMASGEFVKAQQQLEWAVANASQDSIQYLAKIRLAKLLFSTQQLDQALAITSETYPPGFQSIVFELKGDILKTQGKSSEARTAYQQALSVTETPSTWLRDKLNDTVSINTSSDA